VHEKSSCVELERVTGDGVEKLGPLFPKAVDQHGRLLLGVEQQHVIYQQLDQVLRRRVRIKRARVST
jgi:hypothetical protein